MDNLTNRYTSSPDDFSFTIQTDGLQWSVAVPKLEALPGSYILTSEGNIHFNKDGMATTNDVVLGRLR